jgi:hypothetical protein
MGHIKKVFFFPDAAKDETPTPADEQVSVVNYVGILGAERTTIPYLDAPLDTEVATQLIRTLSAPGLEYVILLKHDHEPKPMFIYLQQRKIEFTTRQEVVTYPSSVIYLAALGVKVHVKKHYLIFRTRALEDLRWTIGKYGSLDRMRIFIAKPDAAPQIAEALSRDSAQLDYHALLDLTEYHTLFDYDWEYFFVMTRKPHLGHVVSWLRRACQELGVETETSSETKTISNLRGRLERLTGVSLFRPLALEPVQA